MFTKESVLGRSFKRRLEQDIEACKAAGDVYPEERRRPETIIGDVLSLADVNRLIGEKDKNWMINDCGVVAVNDGKVVFLTDDSYLSLGLPKEFMGMQWHLPNWTHGFKKHIQTAEDFVDLFYRGQRLIQSMDDLLAYLNENYL